MGGTVAALGVITGGWVAFILEHFRSDPYDPLASGGDDFSIHERWGYPIYEDPEDIFVKAASGHFGFEWKFFTTSSESFQIKVTASVQWGLMEWVELPENGIPGYYRLYPSGWTEVSEIVTINA